MIATEIEGVAANWITPMVGFFFLGEFKLDETHCEFHGTPVSWVALKRKQKGGYAAIRPD